MIALEGEAARKKCILLEADLQANRKKNVKLKSEKFDLIEKHKKLRYEWNAVRRSNGSTRFISEYGKC